MYSKIQAKFKRSKLFSAVVSKQLASIMLEKCYVSIQQCKLCGKKLTFYITAGTEV